MKSVSNPAPPEGFATWLDFAVETFDTRAPWLESTFTGDQDAAPLDREAIREAAPRAELRRLRAAAGGSD